jgi:hypothetical protein
MLAEEPLYARPFTSEAERARAIQVWTFTTTTIGPTPPPANSHPPTD